MAEQNNANPSENEPLPREVLEATSFLYGGNAAFIEDLYARYVDDPTSVDDSWRSFFQGLADAPEQITKSAEGASWKRPDWPQRANGELVSALDGDWGTVEKHVEDKLKAKAQSAGTAPDQAEIEQAARDSVRAIMMIRAYRMRGHLHADLDPLGIAKKKEAYDELSPASYGFTPEDNDRKIFIDHVLGLEYATIPQMVDILQRTYCSTMGVEFMHISNPEEKSWLQQRIEGPDKAIDFSENGKKAILQKLIEAEEVKEIKSLDVGIVFGFL